MTNAYLFAIVFGLGAAGVMIQLSSSPTVRLSSRLELGGFREPTPARLLDPKQIWNKVVLSFAAKNKSRADQALLELPEILDLLVVSLASGDGIFRSFTNVIPRCEGQLATEIEKIIQSVNYGGAFSQEIRGLANTLPTPQVAEFASKVALALERGTPLAQMLTELSQSARSEIRNRLLKQAGANETRMLIPLVFLILPVTVLFAIYPSLELLNFGFI